MPWVTINGAHVLIGEDGEPQSPNARQILYRGDSFEKGGKFKTMSDYKFPFGEKNQAGFHFFSDSPRTAIEYARNQQNKNRAFGNSPNVTVVAVRGKILDLTGSGATLGKKLAKLPNMSEDIGYAKKWVKEKSPHLRGIDSGAWGQSLSDFETGKKFKVFLKSKGYAGYKFNEDKSTTYGFVDTKSMRILKKKKLR